MRWEPGKRVEICRKPVNGHVSSATAFTMTTRTRRILLNISPGCSEGRFLSRQSTAAEPPAPQVAPSTIQSLCVVFRCRCAVSRASAAAVAPHSAAVRSAFRSGPCRRPRRHCHPPDLSGPTTDPPAQPRESRTTHPPPPPPTPPPPPPVAPSTIQSLCVVFRCRCAVSRASLLLLHLVQQQYAQRFVVDRVDAPVGVGTARAGKASATSSATKPYCRGFAPSIYACK